MTEIKTLAHLDENLLHVNKYQNLEKNYASLKNLSSISECNKSRFKCKIINNTEVSRALNCYLDKIRSISESNNGIIDEQLLNICQEIRKLSNTPGNNENISNEQSTNEMVSEDSLSMVTSTEIPILKSSQQSDENINESESVSNSISASINWIGQENSTNEIEVTVDDFLIKQDGKKEFELNTKACQNLNEFSRQTDGLPENLFQIDFVGGNQQNEYISDKQHKRASTGSNNPLLEEENISVESDQNSEKSKLSKERPFVCPECKMAFKRNLHLKRHFTVTHTIGKNFKCETCGRMFSRKDYLDKHVSGHQKKDFKLKLLQQGIVVRTKIFSKLNK